MNTTSSSPLGGIGSLLQLTAVGLSIVLGFKGVPVFKCIAIGAVLAQVGYLFMRLPQMSAAWRRDGIKIVGLVIMQFVANAAIVAVFYWIGRGVAHLFA